MFVRLRQHLGSENKFMVPNMEPMTNGTVCGAIVLVNSPANVTLQQTADKGPALSEELRVQQYLQVG